MRSDPEERAGEVDGPESTGAVPGGEEVDDEVDEQSEDSFPASDPPSY